MGPQSDKRWSHTRSCSKYNLKICLHRTLSGRNPENFRRYHNMFQYVRFTPPTIGPTGLQEFTSLLCLWFSRFQYKTGLDCSRKGDLSVRDTETGCYLHRFSLVEMKHRYDITEGFLWRLYTYSPLTGFLQLLVEATLEGACRLCCCELSAVYSSVGPGYAGHKGPTLELQNTRSEEKVCTQDRLEDCLLQPRS